MQTLCRYATPLGPVLLTAGEAGLTGLWFAGQARAPLPPGALPPEGDSPALAQARRWLDEYFAGRQPGFMPPLHLVGSEFQRAVWDILRAIPYGCTVTYGDIARRLAPQSPTGRMSAQAVGGAVGRNPVSILVPCHRVVGAAGRLTGYAGGLERKRWLLEWEAAPGTNSDRCQWQKQGAVSGAALRFLQAGTAPRRENRLSARGRMSRPALPPCALPSCAPQGHLSLRWARGGGRGFRFPLPTPSGHPTLP